MGRESWKATETDIEMAKNGCMLQAQSFGLDVTDGSLRDLIDHQAKVIATQRAECRWLRGIIDELSPKIHKVEPES